MTRSPGGSSWPKPKPPQGYISAAENLFLCAPQFQKVFVSPLFERRLRSRRSPQDNWSICSNILLIEVVPPPLRLILYYKAFAPYPASSAVATAQPTPLLHKNQACQRRICVACYDLLAKFAIAMKSCKNRLTRARLLSSCLLLGGGGV